MEQKIVSHGENFVCVEEKNRRTIIADTGIDLYDLVNTYGTAILRGKIVQRGGKYKDPICKNRKQIKAFMKKAKRGKVGNDIHWKGDYLIKNKNRLLKKLADRKKN